MLTWIALPAIDRERGLERSLPAVGEAEVAKGRPTRSNRGGHYLSQRFMQALQADDPDRRCAAGRMNSSGKQRFGGVDVADTGDGRLVEQGKFDGSAPTANSGDKRIGIETRIEEIGAKVVVRCPVVITFPKSAQGSSVAKSEAAPVEDNASPNEPVITGIEISLPGLEKEGPGHTKMSVQTMW